MIANLVTLAVRLGVPERFARAAMVVALIVLAILALLLAKGCYDDSLIDRHDAERDADLAEQGRAADDNAAVKRREDDARLSSESVQLNEVIANAPLAAPGDARRRYYECIGLQQAARKAGGPVPSCP